MIKVARPVELQRLFRLIRCISTKNGVPEEWGKGIVITVFKKSD